MMKKTINEEGVPTKWPEVIRSVLVKYLSPHEFYEWLKVPPYGRRPYLTLVQGGPWDTGRDKTKGSFRCLHHCC